MLASPAAAAAAVLKGADNLGFGDRKSRGDIQTVTLPVTFRACCSTCTSSGIDREVKSAGSTRTAFLLQRRSSSTGATGSSRRTGGTAAYCLPATFVHEARAEENFLYSAMCMVVLCAPNEPSTTGCFPRPLTHDQCKVWPLSHGGRHLKEKLFSCLEWSI